MKYSLKNLTKDSDRDGVPNVLDCKPYNPNEQGWVHDIAKKAKGKLEKSREAIKEKVEQGKEAREEEKEFRKEAREEEKKVYAEERKKVLMTKARKRAKQRAKGISGMSLFQQPVKKSVTKKTKAKKYKPKTLKVSDLI